MPPVAQHLARVHGAEGRAEVAARGAHAGDVAGEALRRGARVVDLLELGRRRLVGFGQQGQQGLVGFGITLCRSVMQVLLGLDVHLVAGQHEAEQGDGRVVAGVHHGLRVQEALLAHFHDLAGVRLHGLHALQRQAGDGQQERQHEAEAQGQSGRQAQGKAQAQ